MPTQTVPLRVRGKAVNQQVGRGKPPPYVTLAYNGDRFAYDTSSNRFFRVDHATHQFLDHCKTHRIDQVRTILKNKQAYPDSTIDSVANEVMALSRHGLFDVPDYTISDEQLERQLQQRYEAPWNKLELALSESCNLACTYCYCGTCRDLAMSRGLMSETMARQAITWLFAASGRSETVSITFFGGEPLLNKPVFRFAIQYSQHLAKLHGKKVYYSMTTNGTLLDDEVIGYIKRYNFGLMVSLDGPPEIHNRQCPTRGGRGSFDKAAGIKKLMSRRRRVTVRCMMTHPVPRMLDLIQFFEDFGFTRIVLGRTLNPLHPSPVDLTEEDFAECERQEREELIPWMLEKLAAGETPKYFPYQHFICDQESGAPARRVSPFTCGACRGTTTVGADGTLYPCHRFMGMSAWEIGHITTGPDYDRCKQFWRDYHASTSPGCDACGLRAQCKGPCPWEIADNDGTFHGPGYCDHSHKHTERAVYIYSKKQRIDAKKGA